MSEAMSFPSLNVNFSSFHYVMFILNFIFLFPVGIKAIPILWQFLDKYPTAEVTCKADWEPIAEMIWTLGLHAKRAKMIIRFSGTAITTFVSLLRKDDVFHCLM